MSGMSADHRKEAITHEVNTEDLQKWLWFASLTKDTWDKYDQNGRWTHDDNVAVQHLGWQMLRPPGSQFYDLYSLRRSSGDGPLLFKQMLRAAEHDPYAAKAVGILTAQRMEHPEVKFNFLPSEKKVDKNPF